MRTIKQIAVLTGLALISAATLSQQPSFAGFGNLFGGANDGKDGLPNGASSPLTPPGAIGTVDGDDGSARHSDKPGRSSSSASGGGGSGGGGGASPPPGDYTADEMRMQGRYTGDLANAKKTIEKGQRMMKSGNSKVQKKGEILKQIGEKELARLKENNPFPVQHSLDDKPRGTKPDSL